MKTEQDEEFKLPNFRSKTILIIVLCLVLFMLYILGKRYDKLIIKHNELITLYNGCENLTKLW